MRDYWLPGIFQCYIDVAASLCSLSPPQASSLERGGSHGAAYLQGMVSHFGDLGITGKGLETAAQGSPLVGPIIGAWGSASHGCLTSRNLGWVSGSSRRPQEYGFIGSEEACMHAWSIQAHWRIWGPPNKAALSS